MQQGLLPLFPLQVVLFPGGQLPLHIFEDRYKEMIREAIDQRAEFGVVLASEKGIVSAGCSATVDQVLREYPDGRMDILTVGRRRFEILLLNEERVFLRGAVEFFDDEELAAPVNAEMLRKAIDSYNEMQRLAERAPLAEGEEGEPRLSFRLGQPVPELAFRQTLLAARSEGERLRQIAEFLPGYLVRQRRIQHAKNVAPRNGHGLPGKGH